MHIVITTGRLDLTPKCLLDIAIALCSFAYRLLMDFVFLCVPMQLAIRGTYLIGKTCLVSHLRTGRKAAANCSWASKTQQVDFSDSTKSALFGKVCPVRRSAAYQWLLLQLCVRRRLLTTTSYDGSTVYAFRLLTQTRRVALLESLRYKAISDSSVNWHGNLGG